MTGCAECDDQNVMDPRTLHYAARDLHRALHEPVRPVGQFLTDRILDPLTRALDGAA